MTAIDEIDLTEVQQEVQLLSKVVDAALAIDNIDKDKTNTFHNYAYASAESYLFTCRRELLSRRVLVLGAITEVGERARPTRDGESSITTVDLTMRLYDAETGYSLELPWVGRGEDPMDKGVSKALTNAIKTFLRQQLLLPTGDDPEADPSTDERAASMRGTGAAQTSETANLIAEAKGLSDEQLNHVLTVVGLPAAKAPFGSFARVPASHAEAVREALQEVRGG